MRKSLLCIFMAFMYPSFAQRVEIGGGLGPTFYKGDIQPTFRPFNPRAGANLFGRYNYNRVFSFKFNSMAGFVAGDDSKSGNKLNKLRDYKFKQTVVDYNVQAEYNFLNFRTGNGRYEHNWTPYLFAGLGQYISLSRKFISSDLDPNPVLNNRPTGSKVAFFYGIGYKKVINKRWNYGIEFGTRVPTKAKYNDTSFDGLGYDENNKAASNYYLANIDPKLEYANTAQQDKYFYLSFSVSYMFYKVYCP